MYKKSQTRAVSNGMRRFLLPLAVLVSLTGGSIALAQDASTTDAQSSTQQKVTFPIADLGNCASKSECKAYCDVASHREACYAYGEVHGLISAAQASSARQILQKKGPGGCDSKESCKAYCSDTAHVNECKQFAQTHALPAPEAYRPRPNTASSTERGEKIDSILAVKTGPSGCTDRESCKAYCGDSTHAAECIAFAKMNGLMTQDEADRAAKFTKQAGPGGCTGEACKTYCEDDTHATECIAFAKKQGIIDNLKAQVLLQNASTTGPGGCSGITECRIYCSDSSHASLCKAFAREHALMQNPLSASSTGVIPRLMASATPELIQKCNDNPEACANLRGQVQGKGDTQGVGQGEVLPTNTLCKTAEECAALKQKMQEQYRNTSMPKPVPGAKVLPLPGTPKDAPASSSVPSSLGAAVITAFLQLFGQ